MKRHFGIRVHREGRKLLTIFGLFLVVLNVGFFLFVGNGVWRTAFLGFSALSYFFFLNFFRSPHRIVVPEHPGDIVAPADGRIVVIEPTYEDHTLKCDCIQVSIFMTVFDAHANWYPFEGKVIHYSHQNGRFIAANLPKSSQENERSNIIIESGYSGERVLIRQIAGALARRVVTYAYTGKQSHLNEHLGFIKFGSRVDLFFPPGSVDFKVAIGDHVSGNRTVIARFREPEESR